MDKEEIRRHAIGSACEPGKPVEQVIADAQRIADFIMGTAESGTVNEIAGQMGYAGECKKEAPAQISATSSPVLSGIEFKDGWYSLRTRMEERNVPGVPGDLPAIERWIPVCVNYDKSYTAHIYRERGGDSISRGKLEAAPVLMWIRVIIDPKNQNVEILERAWNPIAIEKESGRREKKEF